VRTDLILSLAIFFLALGVRLLYLFQIEAIPLFYNLAADSRAYDEWAQQIASGDWLGREVVYQAPLYPYFLALLQFILGRDLWWIRVVQMVLGAFSCSLLYWVGRSFFSRGAESSFWPRVFTPSTNPVRKAQRQKSATTARTMINSHFKTAKISATVNLDKATTSS